jgi:hypothetical protein
LFHFSNNNLSHNCLLQDSLEPACVLSLSVYSMPRKTLEEVKAYEIEQLRLRTERRVAQLKQESYELELSEVFSLCALLYIAVIVLFYARLYLR